MFQPQNRPSADHNFTNSWLFLVEFPNCSCQKPPFFGSFLTSLDGPKPPWPTVASAADLPAPGTAAMASWRLRPRAAKAWAARRAWGMEGLWLGKASKNDKKCSTGWWFFATPLKNMSSSDWIIPTIGEKKKCSKPPTSNPFVHSSLEIPERNKGFNGKIW